MRRIGYAIGIQRDVKKERTSLDFRGGVFKRGILVKIRTRCLNGLMCATDAMDYFLNSKKQQG